MTIQKTHSADDDMLKRIIELEAANADAVSDYNRCVEDVHAARDRIAELEAENRRFSVALRQAMDGYRDMTTERDALEALLRDAETECDAFKAALVQIAQYSDGPTVNSGFDEPCAAQTARNALDAAKGES